MNYVPKTLINFLFAFVKLIILSKQWAKFISAKCPRDYIFQSTFLLVQTKRNILKEIDCWMSQYLSLGLSNRFNRMKTIRPGLLRLFKSTILFIPFHEYSSARLTSVAHNKPNAYGSQANLHSRSIILPMVIWYLKETR